MRHAPLVIICLVAGEAFLFAEGLLESAGHHGIVGELMIGSAVLHLAAIYFTWRLMTKVITVNQAPVSVRREAA